MSRRNAAPKRDILPDPLLGSKLVSRFINTVMKSGKKSIAESIVYGAFIHVIQNEQGSKKTVSITKTDELSEDQKQSIIKLFEKALENVGPTVEVKSRRVGGANYQVPVEVRADRKKALAMRWLVEFAQGRHEKTMVLRLANEMSDAIQGRGGAVKKREDVHRMAKANQAFAHYRW